MGRAAVVERTATLAKRCSAFGRFSRCARDCHWLDLAKACQANDFLESVEFTEGYVGDEAQILGESCGPWTRTTEAILDYVDTQLVPPDAEMCARVFRNLHSAAELHVLLWLWWSDPESRYLLLAERQSLFTNVKTSLLSVQIALRTADPLWLRC